MVFYRKYRPQTIDDLDNATVRETLTSVLKKNSTHAFLFTGPKGLGKTSTARIIAKAVNCTGKKDQEVEPCNTCEQCVSITNGTNMDILEIDAASNRGIDEIRELKEKIRLAPVSASKKVYIIDEVHMLTTEAFNALLKTLEEPPSHAMFILCTTEAHKVPATILSRCFHLSFHLATKEELVRSFTRIVTGENIEIEKEALEMIADLSEGGFRDGAKVLEEVVALGNGQKITKEMVEGKYQTASISQFTQDLLTAFKNKETKEGLQIVQKLVEQGIDMKFVLQSLIETLHKLMLSEVTKQEKSALFSLEEIQVLFILLTKAHTEMKFAVLAQLPLELAIIEYCQTPNVITTEQHEVKNSSAKPSIEITQEGVTVSSLRREVGALKKKHALYGEPKKEPISSEEKIATTKVELMHASPNDEVTDEWKKAFWNQLISEMKKHNHTIAGVLRGCMLKSFDKKVLVIEAGFKFHQERLDEVRTRDELLKASKLLTGKEIEVKVELRT